MIQNSNLHPRIWPYYLICKARTLTTTTLDCVSRNSVLSTCGFAMLWRQQCGFVAVVLTQCTSNCHRTYALGCAAQSSRNADYRLRYDASKLAVTLDNWKRKETFCSECLNRECRIKTVFQCLGLSALHVSWFLCLKHQIICTRRICILLSAVKTSYFWLCSILNYTIS